MTSIVWASNTFFQIREQIILHSSTYITSICIEHRLIATMIYSDQDSSGVSSQRIVFNGLNSEEMFTSETVPIPELAPGEILVKVI